MGFSRPVYRQGWQGKFCQFQLFPVPGDMDVLPQITFGEASKKIE